MAILPLPLIQEEQFSVNGERMYTKCRLTASGMISRNSVVMITDRPDMTSAVSCGSKAQNQTNKKQNEKWRYDKTNKILELLGKGTTRCVAG